MYSTAPQRSFRLAAAALAISLAAILPAQADTVGTAGAVNVTSTGAAPGQSVRTIEIGAQVVRNEKVNTSGSGSVQIVFIDKTTLNIGPNSTLVIDEFVFSPAQATGQMTLTLGKGVLRLVGGQATHTGGATIKTDVATIGLRGAIATLAYCPSAGARCGATGLQVTNHFGQVTVTGRDGVTQTISRPGFSLTIGAGGQNAGTPVRAAQAEVDRANGILTSHGQQNGGSSVAPSDQLAAQQGVGQFNAALNPALSTPRQGQTTASGSSSNPILATASLTRANRQLYQTAIAQSAAVTTAASIPTPSSITAPPSATTPGVTTPATIVPVLAPVAYALTTTVDSANLGQNKVPYLTASFVGTGNWRVSYIQGYRVGGANPDAFTGTTSRILQAGISVSGSGASQSSGLFVATGLITNDSQFGFSLTGHVEATNRLGGTHDAEREGGSISTPANTANPAEGSIPVDAQYIPSGPFPINQNSFATDNADNVHLHQAQVAGSSNGPDYQFNQTFQPAPTPTGLGASHPDETLQGFVGGTAQTTHFSPVNAAGTHPAPAFIVTNATGSVGDVSVALFGNSSRMGSTFNVVNSSASAGDVFHAGTFNFGYLQSGDDGSRGTYIDERNFGAVSNRTFAGNNGSYTVAETSMVNGAAPIQDPSNDGFHLLMVTSDTVLGTSATNHTSALFPGVQFCACDYTRWGFWSFRSYQQNTAANYGDATEGNLLTWVAGLPSGASEVPAVGSATYTGHVIASIANSGAQYIAASNFQNVVNFGTRSGAVSVPGLDGAAYAGTVAFNTSNPALFGGTIAGTMARSMTLNGSFFKSATSPVGEMGGSVTLNGTNYLGGGIFAAHGQ